MRHLLLIRHSQTQPITGIRPSEFELTDEGRRRCVPFAQDLAAWDPALIVTSEEAKAAETGRIIAEILRIPVSTAPGLEEHHRGVAETLGTQSAFKGAIEQIFDQPDRLMYGEETGSAALARFSEAVNRVLKANPEGNIAIVSHGTVISLFAAKHLEIDVKSLWQKLKMPDLVVLSI